MAIFKGFEAARFQQHDPVLRAVLLEFHREKARLCRCTGFQAQGIPLVTLQFVKSWMIQESGAEQIDALAAWRVDPLRINLPEDWQDWKAELGLTRPESPNQGQLHANLKAAIAVLCRRAFGKFWLQPELHPNELFQGWRPALLQYFQGSPLRRSPNDPGAYAERILLRALDPRQEVPIAPAPPGMPAPSGDEGEGS